MEMIIQFLPFIAVIVVFYFLLIRPQQKRQKAVLLMQSELKAGDKVVTIGGFHGIIDSITDDVVVIKSGDGSRLTFDRNAIRESVQA
ncbi:preprotein translocase subunit YajC [Priestia taiwanensis]|uniref:Preprotein translocase subunit YajC n=1 Tax=Priestia taiwanensis TaxID=1347902 RepID=A0A917ESP6_9BACI|nr:preprotein translocase subunit YajC [Priestia taiwanensis]MBM7363639.1 preprotein translocase subunit YajC [Priestia taiwanensis]GGE75374.1 preprotein translocase subunit YajC [Priestia taiwanensis]